MFPTLWHIANAIHSPSTLLPLSAVIGIALLSVLLGIAVGVLATVGTLLSTGVISGNVDGE